MFSPGRFRRGFLFPSGHFAGFFLSGPPAQNARLGLEAGGAPARYFLPCRFVFAVVAVLVVVVVVVHDLWALSLFGVGRSFFAGHCSLLVVCCFSFVVCWLSCVACYLLFAVWCCALFLVALCLLVCCCLRALARCLLCGGCCFWNCIVLARVLAIALVAAVAVAVAVAVVAAVAAAVAVGVPLSVSVLRFFFVFFLAEARHEWCRLHRGTRALWPNG